MAYDPLLEGSEFRVSDLNDRDSALQTRVNLLVDDVIGDRTLGPEHMTSKFTDGGFTALTKTIPSLAANLTSGVQNAHTYNNTKPASYGSDTVVGGASGSAGWAIVGSTLTTAEDLELIASSGFTLESSGNNVAGVLVEASVEVEQFTTPASPTEIIAIAIQIRDSGGTWTTVDRSERAEHITFDKVGAGVWDDDVYIRVPVATLITGDDISSLYGVRVVCWQGRSPRQSAASPVVHLRSCTLSLLPMQGTVT